MEVDRVGDWKNFSLYMAESYLGRTVDKYRGSNKLPIL